MKLECYDIPKRKIEEIENKVDKILSTRQIYNVIHGIPINIQEE